MQSALLKALRSPSEDCRLFLVGQPIVPVFSPARECNNWYELLLRLVVDDEVYSPSAFLPPEDQTTLLTEIDWWVLRETADIMRCHNHTFSVNFSRYLLEDVALPKRLQSLFGGSNDPLKNLVFEVSERYRHWSDQEIYVMGVLSTLSSLVVDDIGEAALNSLMDLPVDGFKIDGVLMLQVAHEPRAAALVRSLISFACSEGLVCVCEYVADRSILNWLRMTAIDFPDCKLYAQGHAVGGYKNLSRCEVPSGT